jgi:phosphate transport system permease protein
MADARLRGRYAAERRFQAYGLSAILFAAAFVVMLFGSILMKGLPAFFENHAVLNVALDPEVLDVGSARDKDKLAGADYQAVVNKTLRGMFPEVTDRAQRSALSKLLSSGAADDLRARVLANPASVGTTVRVSLPMSDLTDLYFKGAFGRAGGRPGAVIATPSATTGEVVINVEGNEFRDELTAIKKTLSLRAVELRKVADIAALNITSQAADIRASEATLSTVTATNDAGKLARLQTEIARQKVRVVEYERQKTAALEEAASLQKRIDATGSTEVLDANVPSFLVAINDGLVKIRELSAQRLVGDALLPLSSDKSVAAGAWQVVTYPMPEAKRGLTDQQIAWVDRLKSQGAVESTLNTRFFTAGASREPERAGILAALLGTLMTIGVTLALCLPTGVAAAIYLEKFAPKNVFTEFIEVNINNLAAVPSIVFGLLGLAMFIQLFGMPRSSALVGGLVLALLVLPTIIIASRAALSAVPHAITEGALGVGASKLQAIFHHVLPLAMPGIMTGTIIGMAHALGETAPLLLIGMVAFIVDLPDGVTSAATVLPVQIFQWAGLPEAGFQSRTAGGIIVLLTVLILMNGAAILLRKKFERRW